MRGPARLRLAVLASLALVPWACGGERSGPTTPAGPEEEVVRLEVVDGAGQRILAGRRSPVPFRVRALGPGDGPVEGAVVEFALEGGGGGILSQPRALTDEEGIAETFLLEPRPGSGILTAVSGAGEAAIDIVVERAPGRLDFAPGEGVVGLPGHPHPDSVARVRLVDTEGEPLQGVEVWFAGHRLLSRHRDTTDADGWASTVIRQSDMRAGEGLLFAFLLDFPELTESTSRPVAAAARKVILVSVDGLRGDALERWQPPTLSRLRAEGASTARARTVVPSLTTPAHLSLLSGVPPETHGIMGDELSFTAEMAALDPLFRYAGRQGLAARAFVAAEGPLAGFEVALRCRLAFGFDSLTVVHPPWSRIPEEAATALADPEVRMVFVHVPDPDLAGHAHGFDSPEYGEAVLAADAYLGRIVAELEDDQLLVVTSDHGGGGAYGAYQHGSDSPEDVEVPLLLWGARVHPADLGAASILDVAPTVLWSLGLGVPSQYVGRPLLEGFR